MDGRRNNGREPKYHYVYRGEYLTVSEIALRVGITSATLHGRLRRNGYNIYFATDGFEERQKEQREIAARKRMKEKQKAGRNPEKHPGRVLAACCMSICKFCHECAFYDGENESCSQKDCTLYKAYRIAQRQRRGLENYETDNRS